MKRILLAPLVALAACSGTAAPRAERPPNFVILLADDLGYGDLSCQGAPYATPHLDRMAREGTRFTNFLVAQAVCTASRAALMTGCYPNRVGLQGALNHTSPTGIHEDERLLPEVLKERGYATACFGKWHLGHHPKFHPSRHGFDEFFGIPYSNDNGPLHPTVRGIPSLPLQDGEKAVELDPDQSLFTRRFTDRAVSFIERNRERPFFLYVPHVMPHVPIFASAAFKGKSGKGLYADVVQELDSGVGDVLEAIRRNGLDDRTLVLFFSDNGPFLSYGAHAGSSGPLREGKLTTWEGGMRVPFIARWPGRVPAGRVSAELLASIDLLPTFAELAGGRLGPLPIDGRSRAGLLTGGTDGRKEFLHYAGEELQAVREGDWKLRFAHEYLTVAGPTRSDGKPANFENMKPDSITQSGLRGIASRHGYRVEKTPPALYDLRSDPGETRDVSAAHPDVVRRLEALAERAREDLGDALTARKGAGVRSAGRQ